MIIMTTADLVAPEDADYGLSLGADEYVVKPFMPEVMVYNAVRLLARLDDGSGVPVVGGSPDAHQ